MNATAKCLNKLLLFNLKNVLIWPDDIRNILNDFPYNSISEINAEDVEERTSEGSQKELRSAYVDPEISELISTTDNEPINELANQRTYKDEIDEFDEFSKFLDHTKKTFDEGN